MPISDLGAVAAAVTDRTRVIYTETLSNPTLVVADIPSLAAIARTKGLKLVVDNTFTPFILSPLRLGADVVVHSLTKFISGASDIIGGAVCAADGNFVNSLMDLHMGPLMLLGPTMDPKVASELSLRIPHLTLRVREHSGRALFYAERLQALGAKVVYPGLQSHPQHALLQRLANPGYGFGGMLTVELPNLERAKLFMERLQNKHGFGLMAVSLGYFDTLMSASAASTSSELSDAELAQAGISGGLVRLSVGLTGSRAQRWAQLEESYRHVAGVPLGVKPAFKALQVTRTVGGGLKRTPSWHSFGGTLDDTDQNTEEEADDTSVLTTEAAALLGTPSVKVRRLNSGAEIIYRRLVPMAPAAGAAAATTSAAAATSAVHAGRGPSVQPPSRQGSGPQLNAAVAPTPATSGAQ